MRSCSTYFLISLILHSGCASSSDESSASNPSATQDAEGQSAGSARNVEEPTELNNATANEHTDYHTIKTTPESSPAPTIAANGNPMLLESIDTEAHMRQSRSVDTSTPHNWLTLKAEGSRFSIDTPWKLNATQQTVPTKAGPALANILSADYKTAGIVLMYADHPPTAGMSTKFMAEKVLNPIMSSLLRRMKASNPVTEEFEEHGFHGLKCRTDIKTGYCRIHAILVDHRVYQIVVFTDGKLLTDADVDRVISSFRFDVPPTPKPSSAIGATKPLSPEKLQNAFWKEANGPEVVVRGRIRHIRLFQDANPVLCSATVRLYDWNMPDVIEGVDAMFLTGRR